MALTKITCSVFIGMIGEGKITNTYGIFRYGLLNLSTTDPGYFGKGIYCTQYPEYGEYYTKHFKEKNTKGKFSLLLCWALLGRPWAATKVFCYSTPRYLFIYSI
jgi:hypothetical protein